MDAELWKNPPLMIMVSKFSSFTALSMLEFLFSWSLLNFWPMGLTNLCYRYRLYCYSFKSYCVMLVSSLEAATNFSSRWFPYEGNAFFFILLKLVLLLETHLCMYRILSQ